MLMITNYFTIKTLSAARAYVNGESHYSKGHNNAVNNLISLLFTSNEIYWTKFNRNLTIPQGDAKARIALINDSNTDIIKRGFKEGKNHEEDLDDMIWLFKNFKSIPFFKKAVYEWERGDQLNSELKLLGLIIHDEILFNKLFDQNAKLEFLNKINTITKKISHNQEEFSNAFGNGTRKVKNYLFYINIFFILIIISTVYIYFTSMIKKLLYSKHILRSKKEELQLFIEDLKKTKKELSTEIIQHKKIIGTISHDIRSPLKYIQLTSKYLMNKTKESKDEISFKYATSIYKSSSQLYEFTKTLIQYSKIYFEDKDYIQENYSVYELLEKKKNIFEELAINNNTKIVNVTKKNLYSNLNNRVLSIIIHNLLDNAVKHTNKGTIEIGARTEHKKIYFWVEDTGIGMQQDIIDYYTNLFKNRDPEKLILSTYGIGLHLVLELLIIIKAKISFKSKVNEGTIITIEVNI